MDEIVNCFYFISSSQEKGDIINWDNSQWDVKNMIEYEVNYDDICKGQELGQVIFPGKRNFTTSLTLCQSVDGNLIEIESKGQHEKAIDLINTSSFCPSTWIAWWDENDEGNWVSAINSSKHLTGNSFQNWAPGEPNGDTFSNCARISLNGRLKGKYVAINYQMLVISIGYTNPLFQANGLIHLVKKKPVLYVT